MTDLIYLQRRYDRTLTAMRTAANEPARRAHAGLAALYAARIAEAVDLLPLAVSSPSR
jgi:hypothetical protein